MAKRPAGEMNIVLQELTKKMLVACNCCRFCW